MPEKGGFRAAFRGRAVRRVELYFAESTRVLAAEYAGAFRMALHRFGHGQLFPHARLSPFRGVVMRRFPFP